MSTYYYLNVSLFFNMIYFWQAMVMDRLNKWGSAGNMEGQRMIQQYSTKIMSDDSLEDMYPDCIKIQKSKTRLPKRFTTS